MKAAAIQFCLDPSESFTDALRRVKTLVERAARDGAALMACPLASGDPVSLDALENEIGSVAAQHKIALACGPCRIREDDHLFNIGLLFDMAGNLLGVQRQTYRTKAERKTGLAQGTILEVFRLQSTTGNRPYATGLIVGADVHYPEVGRILALRGATILIHLAAPGASFSEETWLGDLWREAQANQVFGLDAHPVGEFGGQLHFGRSAILAPCEMTEGHRGVLAEAGSLDGEEMVVATLDFAALRKVWETNPIFRYFNPPLYQALTPLHLYASAPVSLRPSALLSPRAARRERLAEIGLSYLLKWKSRPGPILAALNRRDYTRAWPAERDTVTVALIQLRSTLVKSGVEFAEKHYTLVRRAVERGAQFVVYPEYTGLALLGLLPGLDKLDPAQSMGEVVGELAGRAKINIGDIFRAVGPAAERVYLTTFGGLAAKFSVYLHAGSIILPDADGRLFNVAHLFGPDGKLIGTQRKLHATPDEEDWLCVGDDLAVFDLPFGKVAMPVCMDFTYWETTRLAELRSADIVTDVAADEVGEDEWLRARGVRMRVHESQVYGLHVFNIFDGFGLTWRGRSAIFAPPGMCAGSNVLAAAEHDDEEEIVIADLDIAALRRWREENPPDYNVALYKKYVPEAYTKAGSPMEHQPTG